MIQFSFNSVTINKLSVIAKLIHVAMAVMTFTTDVSPIFSLQKSRPCCWPAAWQAQVLTWMRLPSSSSKQYPSSPALTAPCSFEKLLMHLHPWRLGKTSFRSLDFHTIRVGYGQIIINFPFVYVDYLGRLELIFNYCYDRVSWYSK